MGLFLGFLMVAVRAARSLFEAHPGDGDIVAVRARRATAIVLLALLLAYPPASLLRADRFISASGARHLALPGKLERLGEVARCLAGQGAVASAATLNHEINYLLAYWTDADLLLPEGFPLHNGQSNESIEDRMASLLRLYRATPERWRDFPVNKQADSTMSWRFSRLRAAREGYLYYLFHRSGPRDHEGKVARIADKLARPVEPATPLLAPDMVVLDEVSRYLGEPDLRAYGLAWKAEDLAIWLRKAEDGGIDEAAVRACAERGTP
jgi:hypothetical protein